MYNDKVQPLTDNSITITMDFTFSYSALLLRLKIIFEPYFRPNKEASTNVCYLLFPSRNVNTLATCVYQ